MSKIFQKIKRGICRENVGNISVICLVQNWLRVKLLENSGKNYNLVVIIVIVVVDKLLEIW